MEERIPRHVSIIMDGNGRWAKARGKERVQGHIEGVESVRACVEAAAEEGVEFLSLYAFSEENWNRPAEEVSALMDLMMLSIRREVGSFVKNGIRCIVLGNRSRLSEKARSAIEGMERETAGGGRMTLVVFLSYSGKWDILQASRRLAEDVAAGKVKAENVDQDTFSQYLITAGVPDPDLLIRTSGEQRISNFLLWQAAYTEFYYTDVLWPDFRKPEFRAALEAYAHRSRRFGKV
jgi:undecaprenyl diphosphate synthase